MRASSLEWRSHEDAPQTIGFAPRDVERKAGASLFGKLAGTVVLGRKFEIYTRHWAFTGLALDTQVG